MAAAGADGGRRRHVGRGTGRQCRIFNLADALYLRPLRFPDVERLIVVASDTSVDKPYFDRESVAAADFRDWRRTLTTVADLVALEWWDPNFSGVERPESLHGFLVTPGYFEMLGVQPLIGRTFTGDDGRPNATRTVILSHALWLRRFNADPGILGTTLRLEGAPHEVIGVMPPRFVVPYGSEVWAPIAYDDATWADRKRDYLMTFGRLADGQTLDPRVPSCRRSWPVRRPNSPRRTAIAASPW